MGATEVVHGVSGSTVALILGVYHELIGSLRSINRETIRFLRRGQLSTAWNKVNGNFLLALFSGIIISLVTITQLVSHFLETQFISVSSFFFGVILISAIIVLRTVQRRNMAALMAFVTGFVLNFFLSLAPPLSTPDNHILMFFAGVLAGITIILPGISSAFILLLVGKYQLLVVSFSEQNFAIIAVFIAGSVIGLWLASRFIYRLFADYYSTTVALLAGLMVGALNKLWPWRDVFEYVVNSKGNQVPSYDKSILPWDYMATTGKDPQVFQAILMMAVGVFMVVLIEKVTAGLKQKSEHGKSFRIDRSNR